MRMKKALTVTVMAMIASVALAGHDFVGTIVGNGAINDHVTNGIAIGSGNAAGTNETGLALVTANGACQVGNGSNTTANTFKYRDSFVLLGSANNNGSSITNLDAANVRVGSSASAFNGYAVTNLDAAKIKVGSTASAFNGNSITNLNPANMGAGNMPAANYTNALTSLGILKSWTIGFTYVAATQGTVTVTAKDVNGDTLAAAKAFQGWFTTQAVQTRPATNGVLATAVTKGSIKSIHDYANDDNYYCVTDTDGIFTMTVYNDDANGVTNQWVVYGAGCYTNRALPYPK